MSHCNNNGCEDESCNGSCKGKKTVASRLRDLRDCDAWRCVCGSMCVTGSTSCGSCKTPKLTGDCAKFGVHFNAERKASDMSPSDVQKVIAYYGAEQLDLPPAFAWIPYVDPATGAVRPGTFYMALGSLGVSHQFCVSYIGGLTDVTPAPVAVLRWGVAGERIACDTGPWVHVMDTPTWNTPIPPVMTGQALCPPVCPPPPCACTPARGAEYIIVQVDPLVTALRDGTIFITRCDWLAAVDNNIRSIDGRTRTELLLPRVTPGAVPVF